ncbi:MAG: hypothetical protein ONB46_20160 [candidate division KSB1 bacterium]|nr:hypothetical protein [candidate division KSB1 bacterium]MDZ7368745.1 hypothetical protein [candidate division KSB1 bacterium]MDZ7406438.1 hypothetical protein [candidate division KSB1 bacterium]
MRYSVTKTALIFLLIFALNYAQVVPCLAGANSKKVPVAFLGIKFDEVPPDLQKRLLERMTETIESNSSVRLIEPDDVAKTIGAEKITQLLAQPDTAALRGLAGQLQVDYIIAGRLANRSEESQRVLLVGELNRFDRATNMLHRFEVLKYYDNFGVELLKFKQEYVETMAPAQTSGKLSWVWLVIGGITLLGIGAMALSSIKAGAEGEGTPPPDRP